VDLGPRSANPRLGGPFLADAATTPSPRRWHHPANPPCSAMRPGDAGTRTHPARRAAPPAPGPTLLDDRVRPMQPPAPQPVWQQRADLHLGAAHQRPPGWPPVPQPRPADRHPIPAPRHGAGGGAERTIVIPAALLTVAVIAAAIVITSQQQQNSNRPQVTLPTGTQTPRTHIRSSSHAAVHRPFPGVWRWIPPATSTSPTAPTIGGDTGGRIEHPERVAVRRPQRPHVQPLRTAGGYRYFTIAMLRT